MREAGTLSVWSLNAQWPDQIVNDPDDPIWDFWGVEWNYGAFPVARAATEADLTFGDPLDIRCGSCGMYFPQAPFSDMTSLAPAAAPDGITPLRGACGLTLTDQGYIVNTHPMGQYYYYYGLDQFLYDSWFAGNLELNIYDEGSGMWNECASYLIDLDLENGGYGRLACVDTSLGTFAIAEK